MRKLLLMLIVMCLVTPAFAANKMFDTKLYLYDAVSGGQVTKATTQIAVAFGVSGNIVQDGAVGNEVQLAIMDPVMNFQSLDGTPLGATGALKNGLRWFPKSGSDGESIIPMGVVGIAPNSSVGIFGNLSVNIYQMGAKGLLVPIRASTVVIYGKEKMIGTMQSSFTVN